jgi:hypothetical protein
VTGNLGRTFAIEDIGERDDVFEFILFQIKIGRPMVAHLVYNEGAIEKIRSDPRAAQRAQGQDLSDVTRMGHAFLIAGAEVQRKVGCGDLNERRLKPPEPVYRKLYVMNPDPLTENATKLKIVEFEQFMAYGGISDLRRITTTKASVEPNPPAFS